MLECTGRHLIQYPEALVPCRTLFLLLFCALSPQYVVIYRHRLTRGPLTANVRAQVDALVHVLSHSDTNSAARALYLDQRVCLALVPPAQPLGLDCSWPAMPSLAVWSRELVAVLVLISKSILRQLGPNSPT